MNTITTHVATGVLAAAAVGGLALAASAPAEALSKSASTVTIHADGVDLSGKVSSNNPGCVSGRTVVVFKVVGTRGGGDDTRLASDTTGDDGSWDTGNTGVEGFFYAKVKANTTCGRASSSTVHAVR